jgi:predicted phosphoribosyltransferase
MLKFRDRRDAGQQLGRRLAGKIPAHREVVVLGLPRGGVPVACEVARAISAPVDILIVRKLGAPFNPELAVGSIASGGVVVFNHLILEQLGLDQARLEPILERERSELGRRERAYRAERAILDLSGKSAVIVDDGAATGATMHAAVEAVRQLGAAHIIVALPSSSREAVNRLSRVADEVVVLSIPEPYLAVGRSYAIFDQLSDDDVADCLAGMDRKSSAAFDAVHR